MTGRPEQLNAPVLPEARQRPRSFATLLIWGLCATLLFAGFLALGTWQVQRLQWKTALIERIGQRVHAAPVGIPRPERWPHVTAESDEYRRVRVHGVFLHDDAIRVRATTRLGSGYWLMTPLRTEDGYVVMVNRGFIPEKPVTPGAIVPSGPDASPAHSGNKDSQVTVTGLLRISEPGWPILRRNDPAGNRWYTRDIRAIAEARNLSRPAPFFIDADAGKQIAQPESGVAPVGGLTVLSFPNNHLVYALTWYGLAMMVAGAALWVAREESRMRRPCRDKAGTPD